MVKRSRRGGKRRVKRRALTAAQVTRALAQNMRYRAKTFGTIITTSAQSQYPIALQVPASTLYPTGVTFFDQTMAEAMRTTAATQSGGTYQTVAAYNALVYSKNWIVCKVKNNALSPCYIKIYDMFMTQDQAYKKAPDTTIDIPSELLYQTIYDSFNADLDPALLLANLKDPTVLAWTITDYFMRITDEGIFNSQHPNIKPYFAMKKVRKVFLQPGQTFEWKVRPKQFTVTINRDNTNEVMGYSGSTYLPLVMARGDLGLTVGGVCGYSTLELAFEFDYGSKMYMKQVYNNGARGIMINTPVFPAATAVNVPGDDTDVV